MFLGVLSAEHARCQRTQHFCGFVHAINCLEKKTKTHPLLVSYQDTDLTVRNQNLYQWINLFRHFSHHAAKFCYQVIFSVPGGQPVPQNEEKVVFTSSQNGQIPFLPNCYLQADCLFLGISQTLIFSWILELLTVTISKISFLSVLSLLLSYMALAHVLSHFLATDFIIKLNQDHTTVLCQMRSEVTGWRLQFTITAARNVIEHLLIKYIQCHVKTKGQKQEWIMILVYHESKPFTVQRAGRDLEKSFRLRNGNQTFFLNKRIIPTKSVSCNWIFQNMSFRLLESESVL